MPRKFQFALVDAFTSTALAGNPCAVILGADSLTPSEMLSIAKEMNQSETAFLMTSKIADLKARYFTPECEIPLAGHPTIASIHIAVELGIIPLQGMSSTLSLELNDGPIDVRTEKTENGLLVRMFQRKPAFFEIHDPRVVLPIFGLDPSDLMPGHRLKHAPIQTVSTGTRQLMVPLKSHEALKKASMNIAAYKEYREKMDFFSPHFFCLGGASREGDTFARHLGAPPDTLEDAFTGSATGGMAAYLWKYGLIEKPRFIAEQGHWMNRPGRAFVELIGERDQIESVSVAGQAVTTVQGLLTL